jgi:hypothetical protein
MKNNSNLGLVKNIIYCLVVVLIFTSKASLAKEQRIYQTDKYGNIQYNKPSYTVKESGRIVEVDKFGNIK